MRIVLITTKAAKDIVSSVVKDIKDVDIDVFVLRNVPVAALATTNDIVSEIRGKVDEFRKYDLIIIPGLVRGSAKVIEGVTGVRTIKGTMYAGDIPVLMEFIRKGIKFSTEVAADAIIGNYLTKLYSDRLREYLERVKPLFKVRDVVFTKEPPPINLFFEVTVTDRVASKINSIIKRLSKSRYQGIILGCGVSECNESLLLKLMRIIRDTSLLIGLDAPSNMIPKLIDVSKDYVDMILNIPLELLSNYRDLINDKVVVLSLDPTELSSEYSIMAIAKKVSRLNVRNVILDVSLRPALLGLTDTLYKIYNIRKYSDKPLFMGISNVYELMDVDTHGVIALLESIAFELGVANLLLTEESTKSLGAVEEGSIARDIIYRAFLRRSPPIDVGLDMLLIKSKRIEPNVLPSLPSDKVVRVKEFIPPRLDKLYYVKIYVDLNEECIIVDVHLTKNNSVVKRFKGASALSLGRAIVREFNLSNEHVLYLGYELSKAELALKLKRSYIQDLPLFKSLHRDYM